MSSTGCIKVVTYAIQLICVLLVLLLIGACVYLHVSCNENQRNALTTCYDFAAISLFTITLIICGFFFARSEHICGTIAFIIFLLATIIMQAFIAFSLTEKDEFLASSLAGTVDDAWETEWENPGSMAGYENWLQCCGRVSPNDYYQLNRIPPNSCFQGAITLPDNLIKTGCRLEYEKYMLGIVRVFNVFAWILLGFEILLVFSSYCLYTSIRNTTRHRRVISI